MNKIDFSAGVCYNLPGDFMYNPEIKERFLQWYDPQNAKRNTPRVAFSIVERGEMQLGKDVAEMTRAEALDTLKQSGTSEYGTVRLAVNTLKKYVAWCQGNQVFPSIPGGFLELKAGDVDFSQSIAETLIRDESDFLSTLSSVREFDQGYPEPPVLALSWLGLRIKEVLSLKENDVDLTTRTITLVGKVLVQGFSDEIHALLEQYVSCKTAERDHRTGWRSVIKDYSTDLFLKRMLPRGNKDFGKPFGYSQMSTAIGNLNDRLKEDGLPGRLTYMNVWESGRYAKLWELEQSGIQVIAPGNRLLVEEVFRHSKSYYSAIRMYKAYKIAFNL